MPHEADEDKYPYPNIWHRIAHLFGVALYTDGEGACYYCGRWH